MAHPIIFYDSNEVGAPTLNNAAGSLINVLDACLINGFNSKAVSSLVVASNVATATASAHGYEIGKIVEIAGATPSGLNGRQKIVSATANTFTFATTGISDQTATGTITSKRAPSGWLKQYSGTNKAMYKRTAAGSSAMMLRVDDTAAGVAAATYARMVMVESATDVDTFAAPSPTVAALSGGYFIGKGANTATAKPWLLVADERAVYIFTDNAASTFIASGSLKACFFGDLVSYRAGDAYACSIGGGTSDTAYQALYTDVLSTGSYNSGITNMITARDVNQIAQSITSQMVSPAAAGIPGGSTRPAYPSPVDNGMVIMRPALVRNRNDAFGHPVRGEMPGMAIPLAAVPVSMHRNELTGLTGFAGTLLVVSISDGSTVGAVMLDITGPWR